MSAERAFGEWLQALDERHLRDLTPAEAARALRALSSCYVERRGKLVEGGALESAGKRAAFALFYAPLHFLVTRDVVRALPGARARFTHLLDIGCGTGTAGAAWVSSLESDAGAPPNVRITGVDRHPWAVGEANWTYSRLGLAGRAIQGDAARTVIEGGPARAILAAYSVNEMREDARRTLLARLMSARDAGSRILVIEPIARRGTAWWSEWAQAFGPGSSREWRFETPLPQRQRELARAAGLDPQELTAKTLQC